jgi:predicted homoserine dehydrogenase-like protein
MLDIPVVADQDLPRARRALLSARIPEDRIAICDSRLAALRAMESRKRVIVQDPFLLMDLPLDIIVEATGRPEAGAAHAAAAIRNGLHVAMVNKETDVTVGPMLKHLADAAGVVYTPVDGDQHGLLIKQVAWARRIGLEVLCGGKSLDAEIVFDPAEPDHAESGRQGDGETRRSGEDRLFHPLPWGVERSAVQPSLEARRNRLGGRGRIGNWDLVELAIMANATGLTPDPLAARSVHCPAVYTSEIPHVLCPTGMGGILGSRSVVDAVTCLRRSGEAGLGGGVFVVFATEGDVAQAALRRGGVCHNAAGDAVLITYPYHLLGIEAITSILDAALGIGTLTGDYLPRYDVFLRATRDLDAGTIVGDDHSPDFDAFLAPAAPVSALKPLPAHLANGNRLAMSVARGAVLTCHMVIAPADSTLWALRAQQDQQFLVTPESYHSTGTV